MVSSIDTVCPKLSEKEGVSHRVFYSGYTIKDYLTLEKGSFLPLPVNSPNQRKKENMMYIIACSPFYVDWAQTTLTRQMNPFPNKDKLIIV